MHQLLSLFSGGAWPYQWLQFGWKCTECGTHVDGDAPPPSPLISESDGYCVRCGKDAGIRRRTPSIKSRFQILSFMTLGALPFHWFHFGWECTECPAGPDLKSPPAPKEMVRLKHHCPKCHQETLFQKKTPRLNIFDRFLSVFSGGWWSVFRINSGWRCSQCSTKIKVNFF
jgi:hypothetical protein